MNVWWVAAWSALLGTMGCAAGGYREARLAEPIRAAAPGFAVEVTHVFLNDDTVTGGVGDGTALIVELTVDNPGRRPYRLNPQDIWCLLRADVRHPEETRMFPPSVSGDGRFAGEVPESPELTPLEVPPGQRRTAWVLFRGYRFAASDVPRRVTLSLPGPDGRNVELVLADPAEGDLRWTVAPTPVTFTFGLQSRALYGGYAQVQMVSTRISRLARAGRFLWDVGLTSTTVVQVKGVLRSSSSSFGGTGLDLHLTLPVLAWGDPAYPVRLGPFVGAEAQFLIATQAVPTSGNPTPPPVYGELGPEIGLELDVGALRLARTPFPLVAETRNPVPRWLLRLGYSHTWIGHGTADGYVSGFRIAW
jgi:hypothetical protein